MNYKNEYNKLVGKIKKAHLYAQTDSTRAVLEDIYPQLSESEDERIRKALIEVFKKKLERGFEWVEYGIPNRSVLDWLEKQKECLADNSKTLASEDERIRKELIETINCMKEDHQVFLSEQQIERYLAYLEKQKDLTIENIYKHSRERMSFWNGQQKEQKPAEWNEEDEEISKRIISDLRWGRRNTVFDKDIRQYDEEINWMENRLKSLRPQYHGDVTMTEAYKMGKEAGEASSWKPSEDQMKALLNAEGFLRAGLQHDSAKTIAELYEHLKQYQHG